MERLVPAGEMRAHFDVQENTGTTQDSTGAPIPVWTTIGQWWAKLESLGGRETMQGREIVAPGATRITGFYRTLTPLNRLKLGTRIFDINSVTDIDDRRRQLRLMCQEQ